jgi:hypothetical protein
MQDLMNKESQSQLMIHFLTNRLKVHVVQEFLSFKEVLINLIASDPKEEIDKG